jgi:hypothetical protein
MRSIFAPLALLCALCAAAITCAAGLAAAQPPATPPPTTNAAPPCPIVRAVRATEPIVIDGVLDEPVWKSDNAVTYLPQSDPNQGAPSAQKLEIRVAYDDDAIYVGARMFDTSPDSIVARLSRRDNNVGADVFAVAFDTFRDKRNGYYFGVSAAGTQFDGTMMNDDWDDDSWDGVWSSHVKRDAQGWTAEMRIPFSQMRCASGDHRVWGINFERFITRYNQDQKLVYTPTGQSGYVSRFAELQGLDGIHMSHHVEVSPYTTGRAEYLAHAPGDPFHNGSAYRSSVGGDLRTNLGAKMTLNATVNPDFGQVEIDPASVNLSDVETYYSEKRPFFTEGLSVFRCGNNGASDYWNFNWPEPMFWYTRRIGRAPEASTPDGTTYADVPVATHILGALKLTGQPAPRLNVGAVSALTEREVADYQIGDSTRGSSVVEPMTYYGILRGLRSFNDERQGLGLMALETHRFFDGTGLNDVLNGNGLVTAMDGWTFLGPGKRWVLSGYSAASRIDGTPARIASLEQNSIHYFQRPDRSDLGVDANAKSLTGGVTRLWLNKQTGNWMSNSAVGFISPGFDANDLGLSTRDDIINGHIGVGYNWNKPNRFKKYFWIIGALAEGWNFGGQHLMNQYFVKASLEQMNAWSWTLSGGYTTQGVSDRLTRGGPAVISPRNTWSDFYWDTNSKAKVFLSNEVQVNGDVVGSHEVSEAPSVTWKPSSNVSFSVGPTLDWNHENAHYITTQTDPFAPSLTYGSRYVFATLEQRTIGAQMRVDCSLTPALSLQMFVQPLVSSGRYWNYRELARGSSYDFNVYGEDGSTVTSDPSSGDITIDPAGGGASNAFTVHPDFTYRTIRGNAVLRWEYVPGSAFYLVWTQDRTGIDGDGTFRFGHSLSALASSPVNNIVMVKVSHHFDL